MYCQLYTGEFHKKEEHLQNREQDIGLTYSCVLFVGWISLRGQILKTATNIRILVYVSCSEHARIREGFAGRTDNIRKNIYMFLYLFSLTEINIYCVVLCFMFI